MELQNSNAQAFMIRMAALHRKNREQFLEILQEKRESCKIPIEEFQKLSDEELSVRLAEHQRQGASRHWIWCLASAATMAVTQEILPEHWEETLTLLEEAEKSQASKLSEARTRHVKNRETK